MQRPLNAIDLAMLGLHEASQWSGCAGFEELSVIWLEGRLDAVRLRNSLDRLASRYPWLAGTLGFDWKRTRVWRWNGSSHLPLAELSLEGAGIDEIRSRAEKLLSQQRDLAREPGLAFELLHLQDGSDALVVRINHALLDHPCATLVLLELNRILRGDELPPAAPYRDLVPPYRKRFNRAQHRRALRVLFSDRRAMKRHSPPRMLSEIGTLSRKQPGDDMAIMTRTWDAQQTSRFLNWQRNAARFSSESMTILGSAFCALSEMIPNPSDDDLYRSHIGVDLGIVTPRQFIPQNGSSILRVQAYHRELKDRRDRVQLLSGRLMEMLKAQRDLAMTDMMSLMSHCYPLMRKFGKRLMRRSFSLFYAHFVVPADLSREFGGVAVRHISYIAPAWSPMGLVLLVSRFRETMEFQVTYLPSRIEKETVEQFLDKLLVELDETIRESVPVCSSGV